MQAPLEDSSLARQVRGAVQSKVPGQRHLIRMEHAGVRVMAEINGLTLPLDLETVGLVGQGADRRTVVWQRVEVLVFPVWRNSSA